MSAGAAYEGRAGTTAHSAPEAEIRGAGGRESGCQKNKRRGGLAAASSHHLMASPPVRLTRRRALPPPFCDNAGLWPTGFIWAGKGLPMSFEISMTFVLASSALMLVPGPTMLIMTGLALNHGLSKALTALPGLTHGLITSISISLLGAGAILLASAQLFTALKLAGAAYLVYLGIRLWT